MQEIRRDGNAAIFRQNFAGTAKNPHEAPHNIEFFIM